MERALCVSAPPQQTRWEHTVSFLHKCLEFTQGRSASGSYFLACGQNTLFSWCYAETTPDRSGLALVVQLGLRSCAVHRWCVRALTIVLLFSAQPVYWSMHRKVWMCLGFKYSQDSSCLKLVVLCPTWGNVRLIFSSKECCLSRCHFLVTGGVNQWPMTSGGWMEDGQRISIAKLWHRKFLKTQTAVVLEVKKDFFPSASPSAKVMFDLPQKFCEWWTAWINLKCLGSVSDSTFL